MHPETRITANPCKIQDDTWGVRFTVDCPIPPDERATRNGVSTPVFVKWLESFEGQTVTVRTRAGRTWETRLTSLYGFSGFGDRIALTFATTGIPAPTHESEDASLEAALTEPPAMTTPLHEAAKANDTARIAELIAAGADVEALDEWDRTPLHEAAAVGHPDAIRALVELGAGVDAEDDEGNCPLHDAASDGTPAAIRTLIELGADPDADDEEGQTALHLAADRAHIGIITTLIEAGADVHARDDNRRTPLHHAAASDRPARAIRSLITASADVTARDQNGETPLHEVTARPTAPGLACLLEAGADPEAEDNYGNTPLDAATRWGREPVIKALEAARKPSSATSRATEPDTDTPSTPSM